MDDIEQPHTGGRHRAELSPYAELIRSFVDGRLEAATFEAAYLGRYLADDTDWTSEEFDVLERLFAEVDDFVADPSLRAEVGGLDAAALAERATAALAVLEALDGGP